MRFYILDSQTNRMLFNEAIRNEREIPGRRGPGFSVPVTVHKVPAMRGGTFTLQDVHPATASYSKDHSGRNFTSYKAGVKCSYVIRVWPKVTAAQ